MNALRKFLPLAVLLILGALAWYGMLYGLVDVPREYRIAIGLVAGYIIFAVVEKVDDHLNPRTKGTDWKANMEFWMAEANRYRNFYWQTDRHLVMLMKIVNGNTPYAVGNKVLKPKGYAFPGKVVSVFSTTAGETRYVVELESADAGALLHIFNGDQLEMQPEKLTEES